MKNKISEIFKKFLNIFKSKKNIVVRSDDFKQTTYILDDTDKIQNGETIVSVKNLEVQFRVRTKVLTAIRKVSVDIKKGETFAVVGESGSGKSVTSLSTMRLIPSPPGRIASGEILFYGNDTVVDLAQISEQEMRTHRGNDIAMIFQEPMTSLNPVYPIGTQLIEPLLIHENISRAAARR
ncbi:MAG: ABC transporter ATP-binding protein, partial [Tenericutes bacterium]|nr:ABC transporter ATP-binding protein [Mycoplasmatota bacterium]